MSKLPDVFKPSEVKEIELLKDGDYLVSVVSSSMNKTSAGTGHYLKATMKVKEADDEDDIGRVVIMNYNLDNPNKTAVAIAEQQFKALCEAIGAKEVEDSNELHGVDFVATIATRTNKGDFPDSNYIKKYSDAGDWQEQ